MKESPNLTIRDKKWNKLVEERRNLFIRRHDRFPSDTEQQRMYDEISAEIDAEFKRSVQAYKNK